MPSIIILLILATIAVIVVGIGYPLVKYLEYLIGQQQEESDEIYSGTGVISEDYSPKTSIMTPTEIKYYDNLCDALDRAG